MATFDVRNTEEDSIKTIIFADECCQNATCVVLSDYGTIRIQSDFEEDSIKVEGKDINGLIKALQKAVELGWDKHS